MYQSCDFRATISQKSTFLIRHYAISGFTVVKKTTVMDFVTCEHGTVVLWVMKMPEAKSPFLP